MTRLVIGAGFIGILSAIGFQFFGQAKAKINGASTRYHVTCSTQDGTPIYTHEVDSIVSRDPFRFLVNGKTVDVNGVCIVVER